MRKGSGRHHAAYLRVLHADVYQSAMIAHMDRSGSLVALALYLGVAAYMHRGKAALAGQ